MTHVRPLVVLALAAAVAPTALAQRVTKETGERPAARRPIAPKTPTPTRRPMPAAAAPSSAATPSAAAPTAAAAKTLAQADADFAQRVASVGFKEAMLPALSDDAVLFMPRAVAGRTWLAASTLPAGTYSWSPAWSAVSSDQSLGVTTGPIAFAATSPDSSRTGQYVTVWSRTPIGWKIKLHLVVPGPQASGVTYVAHQPAGDGRPRGGPGAAEASRATLFIADRALFTAAEKDGYPAALLRVATPDVHLLRGDVLPAVGADSARALLARETVPHVVWQTAGDLLISRAGDFGATYGAYERRNATGGVTEGGNFVRIWERQADGGWRILLDALSPLGR